MVERRDGDEIDLLDAAIRTTGGATLSTTLYVLSGVVYAFVTSPAATGTFFFVTISAALVLRPVKGISQTLQKLGSERGERVESYLGIAVPFAVGYLFVAGVIAVVGSEALARRTVFEAGLLVPAGLYACSVALVSIVTSLVAAIGYPSAETWLTGTASAVQVGVVLVFDGAVATAGDLMLVVAGVRFALFVPVALALGVVPGRPDRHALDRAWTFARWSVPDQILDRFSYNMPVYVLGVVATPAAVGVYEAADRFADFGATIAWRLSSPLLTKVSGDTSAGADDLPYLDGAITGGTGVTVAVLGYLLTTHGVVAEIAFAGAQRVFSITVLLVGGINVLRGFWTLASHAMEGLGKPSVSFRTKLYGLLVSVPIPAVFGAEFGAVAGAAGYAAMNLVVFGYVCYFARDLFGRVPVDLALTARFVLGLVLSVGVTTGVVALLERTGFSPTAVAVAAAVFCGAAFLAVLLATSGAARFAVGRASELSVGWLRSRGR
jgi:O-antigen/teichoic acid export membrane protein